MRHTLALQLFATLLLGACAAVVDEPSDMDGDGTMEVPPAQAVGPSEVVPGMMPAEAQSPLPAVETSIASMRAPEPVSHPGGSVWIAACRTPNDRLLGVDGVGCMTRVDTFDAATGRELFHADTREGGAACSTWVAPGTRVQIRAETLGPGCHFNHFRPGFAVSAGMPCPCTESSESVCTFSVERDTYCGAVFVPDES